MWGKMSPHSRGPRAGVPWDSGLPRVRRGPPPAGIQAGGVGVSSWGAGTSQATAAGANPGRCSEVSGSAMLEADVALGETWSFLWPKRREIGDVRRFWG